MSKYTTELRFICETYAGLSESVGENSIENVITNSLDKLFDFNFPIFDENYRKTLETKIVKHYYTREIGYETVGRWKLALNTKLNEIMPYYNKLYESELIEINPLYTHNITKTGNKTGQGTSQQTTNDIGSKDIQHNETNNDVITDSSTNYRLHSDTPQGGLAGVDSGTYLSDAVKTTVNESRNESHGIHINDTTSTTNNGTKNGNTNTTEEYLESVVGYENKNPSKSLQDYRDTFLNIDMMIINDLNKLFMGIW